MSLRLVVPACVLLLVAACGPKGPQGPKFQSAAREPGYAMGFPERLQSDVDQIGRVEETASAVGGKLETLPGDVKEPKDWKEVAELYRLAHAAGRSRAFDEGFGELEAVARFHREEKDEVTQKVGGSLMYNGKQQGCQNPGALGGGALRALDKVIKKRLKERLHARNVAHQYLEQHEVSLGKDNRETLETQIDMLSGASYALYIQGPRVEARLERLIAESEDVKKTLQRVKADAEAKAAEEGTTPADKKAQSERMAEAQKSLDAIDGAAEAARKLQPKLHERLEKATASYEKALDAMVENTSKR